VSSSLLISTRKPAPYVGFRRDVDFLECAGHKKIENVVLETGGDTAALQTTLYVS